MATHCRIGRVRMKSAPHLEVIPFSPRDVGLAERMEVNTQEIGALMPDMAGYAIVAWDFQGYFTRAMRMHRESQVGPTMVPSFVAEVLRRDLTEDVALETFWNQS